MGSLARMAPAYSVDCSNGSYISAAGSGLPGASEMTRVVVLRLKRQIPAAPSGTLYERLQSFVGGWSLRMASTSSFEFRVLDGGVTIRTRLLAPTRNDIDAIRVLTGLYTAAGNIDLYLDNTNVGPLAIVGYSAPGAPASTIVGLNVSDVEILAFGGADGGGTELSAAQIATYVTDVREAIRADLDVPAFPGAQEFWRATDLGDPVGATWTPSVGATSLSQVNAPQGRFVTGTPVHFGVG